jgi:hypothetical protein
MGKMLPDQLKVVKIRGSVVSLIRGRGMMLRNGWFEVGTFEPSTTRIEQFVEVQAALAHFESEVERLKNGLS